MTTLATRHPGGQRREYRLVRHASPQRQPLLPDPGQAAVTGHASGPLLVVGAPGTGKTTTLVEAVAARVAAGVSPDRILVLTFGRRGALRLRDRILARLGAPDPATRRGGVVTLAEPLVRTFHGYAFGLLRGAAVAAGRPVPRLLTGPEQDLVIRELLDDADVDPVGWPDALLPALRTRAFATELRDLLLRCAERGVGPDRLAELAAARGRADWAAAAGFYRRYLQVLALREGAAGGQVGYDYAELVRAAIGLLFDDPGLLAAERGRLAAVYVDELADTDPAQIDLLDAVAGRGGCLVAFADPDSSTFTFRGADPGVVATFRHRFPVLPAGTPAPQITLTRTYRGNPALLAARLRLARRLRGPARHRQVDPPPEPPAPGPPVDGLPADGVPASQPPVDGLPALEVRTFRSDAAEAAYVAHQLRVAHLLHGVPWARMAVIVRSTQLQLAWIRRALLHAGVPVVTAAEDLPLHQQPAVAPLLLALRCAMQPQRLDEAAATALLHSPLGGADPLAERRLRLGLRAVALAGGDRSTSGALLVAALRDPRRLTQVSGRRWAAPAVRVGAVLDAMRQRATRRGTSAEDVLWAAWDTSGLGDRWAAASAAGGPRGEAADRDLDAVLALFDAAARFADRLPGAGPAVFADHVEGQDLPSDSLAPVADRGETVRILTAHAAKGLEWDVVAVAGVQEGIWPDLRLRGSVLGSDELVDVIAGREMETVGRLSAMLDEERRLCYVAASRATRRLIVTASVAGDGEQQPSRFLTELLGAEPPQDGDGRPGAEGGGRPAPGVEGGGRPAPGAGVAGPMNLPALVARLRAAAADPDAPAAHRSSSAALLAELAAAGVPGADPDQWWGLAQLSDARPLVDRGEPVRVTPSTVDSVQRCSLRWLLERHGGSAATSPERSIGNLVHAAAVLAGEATADRAALVAYVAERFDAIELSARWLVGRERDRADAMLDKLIDWLAGNPRRLVGIEREFLAELADPEAPIEIRGRVDRLELDADGRLVVVDLKTGRSAPAGAELAEHAQLAAYQVAIGAGAFPESSVPGGALLLQLGGAAASAREQSQPPLAEALDPGWATDLIRRTARTMAASTFEAVANDQCRVCPVRTSCPVSGRGSHVVTGD